MNKVVGFSHFQFQIWSILYFFLCDLIYMFWQIIKRPIEPKWNEPMEYLESS